MKKEKLIIDLYNASVKLFYDKPDYFIFNVFNEDGLPDYCEENLLIIAKSLRILIAKEIDTLTKKNKLLNFLPNIYDYINISKAECIEDGILIDYIQDEIDALYELIDQNEWAIFEIESNKFLTIITRGDDWRAIEYERITRSKEDDDNT